MPLFILQLSKSLFIPDHYLHFKTLEKKFLNFGGYLELLDILIEFPKIIRIFVGTVEIVLQVEHNRSASYLLFAPIESLSQILKKDSY